MIFVFDMVFSLWASIDAAGLKNSGLSILFPFPAAIARNIPAASDPNDCHADPDVPILTLASASSIAFANVRTRTQGKYRIPVGFGI
jgi:hypothetical protein